MQFRVKDLAERAIAYGIPGVIVDGTDACQVYDACHEACERARRGEGPTLIEAKMMRMKGHAIHDAARVRSEAAVRILAEARSDCALRELSGQVEEVADRRTRIRS